MPPVDESPNVGDPGHVAHHAALAQVVNGVPAAVAAAVADDATVLAAAEAAVTARVAAEDLLTGAQASGTYAPTVKAALLGADVSIGSRPKNLPHSPRAMKLTVRSLLTPTAGTFDSANAGIGYDVALDPATGKYTLLYSGYDGSLLRIGVATADNLDGPWIKTGTPLISANATSGQPDSGGVTFPQTFYEDGLWYIYYVGFPEPGFEVGVPTVCLITTPDLTAGPFTRRGPQLTTAAVAFAGASGVIYRPNVFKLGTTYYMFFNAGTAIGVESIGYATATSPLGPWTVGNSGSPVITSATIVGGGSPNNIVSDPEVVRVGETMVCYFWSGSSGIWTATSDLATEFPNTWRVNPNMVAGLGPYVRPVFVDGPDGPRLLLNHSSGRLDSFTPTSAVARHGQRTRLTRQGRSYRTPGAGKFVSNAAGNGYMVLAPLPLDTPTDVYSLSVNVTVAAAATLRVGLYADNGEGYPGRLITEGVTSSNASTTGIKTYVLPSAITVPAGSYWLAFVPQGAGPQVISADPGYGYEQASSATLADMFAVWNGLFTPSGGVGGALPDPAPSNLAVATGAIGLVVLTT